MIVISLVFFWGNHGEQFPHIFVLYSLFWNSNMLWVFSFHRNTILGDSSGNFFLRKPRQAIASLNFFINMLCYGTYTYRVFWGWGNKEYIHKSKLSYILEFLSPRKNNNRRFNVFQDRSAIEHGLIQQYICTHFVWESTTYFFRFNQIGACINDSLYYVRIWATLSIWYGKNIFRTR